MVEQAESAVHIFGKPILCALNGAIIAIILRQTVQPGSQRRQHIRSFGLVLKLLFNDGNGIIEVCVFRIGSRDRGDERLRRCERRGAFRRQFSGPEPHEL